jgi:Cysteine rich repeat
MLAGAQAVRIKIALSLIVPFKSRHNLRYETPPLCLPKQLHLGDRCRAKPDSGGVASMSTRLQLPRSIATRNVAALALLALPLALSLAVTVPAAAQPSPEIETLRQACRSDFMAHCVGVQPGGREALQCLERNRAQLSGACGSAVSAIVPEAATQPEAQQAQTLQPERQMPVTPQPEAPLPATPQPASAPAQPSQQEELAAVQRACTIQDFMAHCSWIAPGSPELLLCLRANATELSPECQNVVRTSPAAATPAAAAAPTAPSMTSPPATTPPLAPLRPATAAAPAPRPAVAQKKPSPKQLSAVRSACRSDFIAHCSGVQPGGRDALLCLERNKAEISQSCQSALAPIVAGAAAGPGRASPGTAGPDTAGPDTTLPASATAPPAAIDRLVIPRLPLRAEIMLLRVCAVDHRLLCDGVPPGGGRIIACLARKASKLMPECRAALAAASG